MSNVVRLKKPKPPNIKGEGHKMLEDAYGAVGEPVGIAIVVIGADGRYAFRGAFTEAIKPVDLYNRGQQLLRRAADQMIEDKG